MFVRHALAPVSWAEHRKIATAICTSVKVINTTYFSGEATLHPMKIHIFSRFLDNRARLRLQLLDLPENEIELALGDSSQQVLGSIELLSEILSRHRGVERRRQAAGRVRRTMIGASKNQLALGLLLL